MTADHTRWLRDTSLRSGPTMMEVLIEPSEDGADDISRLLGTAAFNGLCRTITALADRGLLCADELRGIEDAMTTPLDDPEWRDDDFIAAVRDTVLEVTASSMRRTPHR